MSRVPFADYSPRREIVRAMAISARALSTTFRVSAHPEAPTSTVAIFDDAAKRFEVRSFAFPVHELSVFLDLDYFRLKVSILVPSRDSGELLIIDFTHGYSYPSFLDIGFVVERFREGLGKALLHELDEAILLDGVRIYDPHRDDDRRSISGESATTTRG